MPTLFDELKSDGNGGHISYASNEKFQGYMIAKLEDISTDLKEGNARHAMCKADMVKRTDKNKEDLGKIRVHAAFIAGAIGTFSGGAIGFLKGLI